MTIETIDRLLINLDKIAQVHLDDKYGLPLYSDKARALLENEVVSWLNDNYLIHD